MDFSQCGIDVLRDHLMQDAWFAGSPPTLQDALLAHGRLLRLSDGQALYHQGQAPAHALLCVVAGAICVGNVAATGGASMVVYLQPCHWFGDVSLIDGQARQQNAWASGSSTVLVVALNPFLQWLERHPAHWRDIARLSAYKLRLAYQALSDKGQQHQRLARRLWWMAHGFGSRPNGPRHKLHVSQAVLAQMLGCSRQSINMALRDLERRGLIALRYRRIEVLDLEALRDLAEADTGTAAVHTSDADAQAAASR